MLDLQLDITFCTLVLSSNHLEEDIIILSTVGICLALFGSSACGFMFLPICSLTDPKKFKIRESKRKSKVFFSSIIIIMTMMTKMQMMMLVVVIMIVMIMMIMMMMMMTSEGTKN